MSPSSLKRLVPLCGVVVLVVCALVALPGGELLARDLAATVARSAPYWIDGGHPNTLGGRQASASQVFEPSRLTLAGALTYEDMKTMEEEARGLLRSNRQFRESISPHDEQVDFDTLVRQFDYDVGFSQDIPGGMTLQERLDQADRELRRARDLYAILAVYADGARFRADPDYQSTPPGYTQPLCTAYPVADDPLTGEVDWCNFANRLRQSVREVAYLRMIFGQQFTADALGLYFGSDLLSGDAYTRQEVEQLQMAVEQYELAQAAVVDGMSRALGSGCYISDFYDVPEWNLVSRAVDGRERAQMQIGVRLSYLDDYGRVPAQKTYRAGAIEQYLQLVGTAGQRVRVRPGTCQALGSPPDNDLFAKMVADMLDTREQARQLREVRNVFGFDVHFTPARPYLSSAPAALCVPGKTVEGANSTDVGLWDEACAAALSAKAAQDDAAQANRDFDTSAADLAYALQAVRQDYDARLVQLTGCSTAGGDTAFFECVIGSEDGLVDGRADSLASCDVLGTQEDFDACMAPHPASQLKDKWNLVRAAYLHIRRVQTELNNFPLRVQTEVGRNATIVHTIWTNGKVEAVEEFVLALIENMSVSMGFTAGFPVAAESVEVSNNPAWPLVGVIHSERALRQACMEVTIENANSEAVVRNLLLDMAEVVADLTVASQEFNAQAAEFQTLAAETKNTAVDARRARAYVASTLDPSVRLVRDSARLTLANRLNYATQVSYMAAKRAEYEYSARLSNGIYQCGTSTLRISDIYRARTADDVIDFLNCLKGVTNNLVLADSEIQREDFTVSVAQHVLGLTDENLAPLVVPPQTVEELRVERFREWVAAHTLAGTDGKPVLVFNFPTSIATGGFFDNVILQSYSAWWLHQVSGVGEPKPANTGFGMNLQTEQTGALSYRRVTVTQSGLVHLRSRAGCIFEYRMIHPAALLGLDWPSNQPAELATAEFKSAVNGANGETSSAFLARPVSASDWQIQIFAGNPELGLIDMDLQQLTDIKLLFSTTKATRSPGEPRPEDCVRVDY